MADDILVLMDDRFALRAFDRSENDHAAGEMLFYKTTGVADFFADFLETFQCRVEPNDFHSS